MADKTFKNVGQHPEDLADGVTVEPLDVFKLSANDLKEPHNQRLINEGTLAEVPASKSGSGGGSERGDD